MVLLDLPSRPREEPCGVPPIGSSLRWDGGRQTTGSAVSVALLHRMLHRSSLIRRSAPAVLLRFIPRARAPRWDVCVH